MFIKLHTNIRSCSCFFSLIICVGTCTPVSDWVLLALGASGDVKCVKFTACVAKKRPSLGLTVVLMNFFYNSINCHHLICCQHINAHTLILQETYVLYIKHMLYICVPILI